MPLDVRRFLAYRRFKRLLAESRRQKAEVRDALVLHQKPWLIFHVYSQAAALLELIISHSRRIDVRLFALIEADINRPLSTFTPAVTPLRVPSPPRSVRPESIDTSYSRQDSEINEVARRA